MNAAKWASVAVALVAVLGSGCAQEQEALIALHTPAFADDYACTADPSSTTFLQRGLLDVAYPTSYTLPVILRNNLISRSSSTTNNQIEDGELQLRDVDVSLVMDQAPDVLAQVRAQNGANVEFTQPLPSESLAPSSETGVLVDVISDSAAQAFADAIESVLDADARPILTAELVFHATRTGNSSGRLGVIDSRTYTFPIELCLGCLGINCSSCTDGVCPMGVSPTGICGNTQDGALFPAECGPPM